MNEYYTTFDVVKIIGIKMERLQDWMKRGYIRPTYQEPVGRGMKNYFSRIQLYVIKTFHYLVDNGITRKEAADWTKDIEEVIEADEHFAETRTDLSEEIRDSARKKPTYIVIYKGGSPEDNDIYPNEDLMYLMKDDNLKEALSDISMTDAVHIINFKKIIDTVERKISE